MTRTSTVAWYCILLTGSIWVRLEFSEKRSFYPSTGQFLGTKKSLAGGSPGHLAQLGPHTRGTFTAVVTGRATFALRSGADLYENCLRSPVPPTADRLGHCFRGTSSREAQKLLSKLRVMPSPLTGALFSFSQIKSLDESRLRHSKAVELSSSACETHLMFELP